MGKCVKFSVGSVELTISFDSIEELKTALGQVEEIEKVLKDNLPEASTETPKTVRKDLDGIFEYQEGKLVMVKAPKSKVAKVCLAIYAINGDGATTDEIERISHVEDPGRNVIRNTGSRDYFRRSERGLFLLSDIGLTYVINEVLPEVRGRETDATS